MELIDQRIDYLKTRIKENFEQSRKTNLIEEKALVFVTLTKKEMNAMKLDDISVQDSNHLVCGFTELGMVDPFSKNVSNPNVRWNEIRKFNNKKNPDIEYIPAEYTARHTPAIKFPSKPLLFKMMRACVNVY